MMILAFTYAPVHTLSAATKLSARASFKPLQLPTSTRCLFSSDMGCRKIRGMTAVTYAGASATSYLIAFSLPFSLLVVTIFTAMRIGDKLDQDFLEELARNEAIRRAEEEDDEDFEDYDDSLEDEEEAEAEIAFSPTRNRPIREV